MNVTKQRSKRVYVGGTFDLFHAGHVKLLRFAKHGQDGSEDNEVVVALNTDEFSAEYKRKPVTSYDERRIVVRSCQYVSSVVPNESGANSRPTILAVRPTHILHGSDWTGESLMDQLGVTQAWLDTWGIEMLYAPYTTSVSTSDIIKRCRSVSPL